MIDFPDLISAVIFTQGCNFRCFYCHNPELVYPERFKPPLNAGKIVDFLAKRRGQLEGVVITGGEPLIHDDLPAFLQQVRELGYQIKLDTNGSMPARLHEIIKARLIDYVAMDIKASPEKYPSVIHGNWDLETLAQSREIITKAPLKYEFRLTLVDQITDPLSIGEIGKFLQNAKLLYLQRSTAPATLHLTVEELEEIKRTLKKYIAEVLVR